MIIFDPFGSWVKGAHEGLSDALAMRQGQDATARSGYDLQRDTQIDPYKAQEAQAEAGIQALNLKQGNEFEAAGIPLADQQARLHRAELANTQISANMGDRAPYFQYQQQHGAQIAPEGLQYPTTDYSGKQQFLYTPYGEVQSPGQDRMDANHERFLIQQERIRQAQARIDAAAGRTNGGGVLSQHSPFGAGGIPGASPMPAGQQMSPINLNDPSAMYNLHQ